MYLDTFTDQGDQMEIVVNDVTNKNFTTLWPSMMLAIKNSSFIAVDLVRILASIYHSDLYSGGLAHNFSPATVDSKGALLGVA